MRTVMRGITNFKEFYAILRGSNFYLHVIVSMYKNFSFGTPFMIWLPAEDTTISNVIHHIFSGGEEATWAADPMALVPVDNLFHAVCHTHVHLSVRPDPKSLYRW